MADLLQYQPVPGITVSSEHLSGYNPRLISEYFRLLRSTACSRTGA